MSRNYLQCVSKFERLTVSFDGWNHLVPLSAWAILWVVRLTVSLRSNTRWSSVSDLNQQPAHYKCAALPIEPTKQKCESFSRWVGGFHPPTSPQTLYRYSGRGIRIRTEGPLLPKQMRYQTALYLDKTRRGK